MKKLFLFLLIANLASFVSAKNLNAKPVETAENPNLFFEHNRLNNEFKVRGGAGILQFVNAVFEQTYDYQWAEEDVIIDKKNGYFEYGGEGDGIYSYKAAYWNRSDGKKLFIISYFSNSYISDVNRFGGKNQQVKNEWCNVKFQLHENGAYLTYIGSMAYLYDANSQKLVPLKTPPYNGIPQSNKILEVFPPQHGRDMKICLYDDIEYHKQDYSMKYKNQSYYMLKFNGLSFDFQPKKL